MQHQYDELLIDGKNSIYRAVFAGLSSNNNQYLAILSRLILSNIKKFSPKVVNVMWDYKGPIWRSRKYPPYKDRSAQRKKFAERYGVDTTVIVNEVSDLSKQFLNLIGIPQYEFKYQEADDLIYTYCDLHRDRSIVILSSDGDLVQIQHRMPNVSVFNPLKGEYMLAEGYDPVIVKCLMGDVSDNIKGFKGIGPVKAKVMSKDEELRNKFLNEGDGSRWDYYRLYELLIDLSKNPFAAMNKEYIINQKASFTVNTFNMQGLQQFIRENKQVGLLEDLTSIKRVLNNLCF